MKSENPPQLHGLVYDIAEGILKDLNWREDDRKRFEHIYNIELVKPEPEVKAKALVTVLETE